MSGIREKIRSLYSIPPLFLFSLWFFLLCFYILAQEEKAEVTINRETVMVKKSVFPYGDVQCYVLADSVSLKKTEEGSVNNKKTQKVSVYKSVIKQRATLVDLNKASKKELQSIRGIGEVLAQRIIAERERLGSFSSISQLLVVKGIGKKKLAAISAEAQIKK